MDRVRRVFCNDRGLRAGWRFAIFFAIYIGSGPLLSPLLDKLHFPGREFTWSALLANYLFDFAFLCALVWVMSRFEHRRFGSYGLGFSPGAAKLFLHGLIWGFIPSALILVPIYFLGGCSFHGLALHGTTLLFYAAVWAVTMLALGFGEEFLFRGYALQTLGEAIGFWPAAFILSFLFGLIHFLFKANEGWIDPLSVGLYGLFWCFTLRRTGTLWFAIGFHAMSDYADMIVFAEPNTGNQGQPIAGHLLNIQFHGPDWLTGGPRGTEASVFVFLVLAALFWTFHHAYPARPKPEVELAATSAIGPS